MKRYAIGMLLSLFGSTASFAFFCPSNFSQIDPGDTIAQVKQACGNPDKETTTEKEANVPQEWSFYIPQTVAANTAQQEQGTLKTSVTFDQDGNAINISVNGIGVGASTICGTPIKLGDSQDTIKSACGKPSFVNKQQLDGAENKKIKMTELLYNANPPVTLVFQEGILTGSK